jgi:uncharacterized protein (TIGR03437 family)
VPPGEGMRLVSLTIAGHRSNTVTLPIGQAMHNVRTPSFTFGTAAPESMESALPCNGTDLVNIERGTVVWGTPPNLPTVLGGTSITVTDSGGVTRFAPLVAATWNQVNYLLPAGTASGVATVAVISGGRLIAAGDIEVAAIAPSLFFEQLQLVRVRNGVQTIEPVLASGVDLGPETDRVYLVLYGTGIRGISSLSGAAARIAGIDVPVVYAGAQGEIPGLDQVNLFLPRSLAGRGFVELGLSIDGKPANPVNLRFQ